MKELKTLRVFKYVKSGMYFASLGGYSIHLDNDMNIKPHKKLTRTRGLYNIVSTSYRIEVEVHRSDNSLNIIPVRRWNVDNIKRSDGPFAPLEDRVDISPSRMFTNEELEYIGVKESSGVGLFLIFVSIVLIWWLYFLSLLWINFIMFITGILIIKYSRSQGDQNKRDEILEAKERVRNKIKREFVKKIKDIEFWNSLTGQQFEKFVGEIFSEKGYVVEITKVSNDKGVDLILTKDEETVIVQCKRYSNTVGVAPVRELNGIRPEWPLSAKFMLVSLYDFSEGAKKFARSQDIQLFSIKNNYLNQNIN